MPGFTPEKPQMNLSFDAETFFDNLLPEGTAQISGSEMIDLFKKAADAGLGNQDLQSYLSKHGISIVGSNNQDNTSETIEYRTFGTGYDTPQARR